MKVLVSLVLNEMAGRHDGDAVAGDDVPGPVPGFDLKRQHHSPVRRGDRTVLEHLDGGLCAVLNVDSHRGVVGDGGNEFVEIAARAASKASGRASWAVPALNCAFADAVEVSGCVWHCFSAVTLKVDAS